MMRSAWRDEIRVAGVYVTPERMEGARCEAMNGFWDMDVREYVSREEALRHPVRTVLRARQKYAGGWLHRVLLQVHDVTTCVTATLPLARRSSTLGRIGVLQRRRATPVTHSYSSTSRRRLSTWHHQVPRLLITLARRCKGERSKLDGPIRESFARDQPSGNPRSRRR